MAPWFAVLPRMRLFFGRKFSLIKENPFEQGEEERIKLGLMMMVLLEKRRG